jgi:hypothetical protein
VSSEARAKLLDDAVEAARQQLPAAVRSKSCVPAGFVRQWINRLAVDGHHLQIRLILLRRPAGQIGQEGAAVFGLDGVEFGEGGEEMIVGGFPPRHEAAHGEAVDQGVAQSIVGSGACGGHLALPAAAILVRQHQRAGPKVGAQAVFGGGIEVAFGIHRSGQVVVQVAALGHAQQKGVERGRVGA